MIPCKIFHTFNCLNYPHASKKHYTLLKTTVSRGKMGFEWSESTALGLLRSCIGKWHWVYDMDLIWHKTVALSTELEFNCIQHTGLSNQGECLAQESSGRCLKWNAVSEKNEKHYMKDFPPTNRYALDLQLKKKKTVISHKPAKMKVNIN